jgi:hypothetical protein
MEPLFAFLEDIVVSFGDIVEPSAIATIQGSSIGERERLVGRVLEELLLDTVAAAKCTLGGVWSSSSEQREGQPAFETKFNPLPPKIGTTSNASLAGMLSLLERCLDFCPVFLFQLPSGPGLDRDDDRMLRRALDSAVLSLSDSDPSIVKSGMTFLKSAVSLL